MHMLIFAADQVFPYCTPSRQNGPSDTQIHVIMKTAEQFDMFAFMIAMSESDQFIEVFFFHANPLKGDRGSIMFYVLTC